MTSSDSSEKRSDGFKRVAVVIGANSQIAQATVLQLANPDLNDHSEAYDRIVCFSRGLQPSALSRDVAKFTTTIDWRDTSYTSESIAQQTKTLHDEIKVTGDVVISRVIICLGKLHGDCSLHNDSPQHDTTQLHVIKPEKRLEDFHQQSAEALFQINTITPIMWLQNLLPLIKGKTPCKVAVFSARVGSIGDNGLGGWYAYRASKAALNMMLKTMAIEWARRAKNVKLVAFHPGTVDTPLSKPFQASVPPHKLFTPEFVAQQLTHILDTVPVDGALSYLDWNNQPIPW